MGLQLSADQLERLVEKASVDEEFCSISRALLSISVRYRYLVGGWCEARTRR